MTPGLPESLHAAAARRTCGDPDCYQPEHLIIITICHLHQERPDLRCRECVTALEVTYAASLAAVVAVGLALAWPWKEQQ